MLHFKCCGLSPESIPVDITCMKPKKPAESAIQSIREFWFDTTKSSNTANNDILEEDMIAEDIPELIIDEAIENSVNKTIATDSGKDSNDTMIEENDNQDVKLNENIALCGTCSDIPYNIATYHSGSISTK